MYFMRVFNSGSHTENANNVEMTCNHGDFLVGSENDINSQYNLFSKISVRVEADPSSNFLFHSVSSLDPASLYQIYNTVEAH